MHPQMSKPCTKCRRVTAPFCRKDIWHIAFRRPPSRAGMCTQTIALKPQEKCLLSFPEERLKMPAMRCSFPKFLRTPAKGFRLQAQQAQSLCTSLSCPQKLQKFRTFPALRDRSCLRRHEPSERSRPPLRLNTLRAPCRSAAHAPHRSPPRRRLPALCPKHC